MMLRSRMKASSCITDLGAKILPAIAALLLTTFPAGAEQAERPVAYLETDCRYVMSDDPQAALVSEPIGKTWFPRGDIFRPLLADMKQPAKGGRYYPPSLHSCSPLFPPGLKRLKDPWPILKPTAGM